MAGNKLFIGNLPWRFTSDDLQDLFANHGSVVSARVITERETGRSKGFGFIEFENSQHASTAIQELDGHEIDGRALRVSEAQERER